MTYQITSGDPERTKHIKLKVVSLDLTHRLLVLNSGDLAMLTLLDLSTAFDSVDHHTLLKRLHKSDSLGRLCC